MNQVNKFVNRLHNLDLGILFVRLALAVTFIHAGWLKITNMAMVVDGFSQVGIPVFLAYAVSYVEFLGGIALVLGVLNRYIGIIFAIIMVGAIFLVHLPHGFGLQNNGYEYTLVLLLASLSLVFMGGGSYTVNRLFKR